MQTFHIDKDISTITNSSTGYRTRLGEHELKLLLLLICNHGVIQPKDALLKNVWGKKITTPNSLIKAISSLRCILHDTPPYKIIINQPRVGYYLHSSAVAYFSFEHSVFDSREPILP